MIRPFVLSLDSFIVFGIPRETDDVNGFPWCFHASMLPGGAWALSHSFLEVVGHVWMTANEASEGGRC